MQHRQRVVEQVLHPQYQPVEVRLRLGRQVGAALTPTAVKQRLLAFRLFVAEPGGNIRTTTGHLVNVAHMGSLQWRETILADFS